MVDTTLTLFSSGGTLLLATIGFISDIHANREALEAVLADVAMLKVDTLICLGDVVGYGPDPDVCLDLVAAACDVMIRGNHDEALVRQEMEREFNPRAWRSLEASRAQLTPGHLMLIQSMRDRAVIEGLSLTHGSFGPQRYEYLYDSSAADRSFEFLTTQFGFIGHTHLPSAFFQRSPGAAPSGLVENHGVLSGVEIELPATSRVILNPGSVGQPRDRNPDASWGLFDSERRTWQVRRVEYDIDAVQRKMEARGLPDYHALRLRAGV